MKPAVPLKLRCTLCIRPSQGSDKPLTLTQHHGRAYFCVRHIGSEGIHGKLLVTDSHHPSALCTRCKLRACLPQRLYFHYSTTNGLCQAKKEIFCGKRTQSPVHSVKAIPHRAGAEDTSRLSTKPSGVLCALQPKNSPKQSACRTADRRFHYDLPNRPPIAPVILSLISPMPPLANAGFTPSMI